MSDPNTPQPVDIDALQKLYDASTPGEWVHGDLTHSSSPAEFLQAVSCNVVSNPGDPEKHFVLFRGNEFCGKPADAAFTAAAHEAMPQLLAEVRELREEVLWWANAPAGAAMNEKNSQLAASQEREKRLREMLKESFYFPEDVGRVHRGDEWEALDKWDDKSIDAELAKE